MGGILNNECITTETPPQSKHQPKYISLAQNLRPRLCYC